MEQYDAIVVGAGHAGCEAALALARMGHSTLLLTLNLDSIALLPCNPAIGGTAKGHLVRELDALGGEMGRAIDETLIQSRMLNTGKGPAVHSLRAQADKRTYPLRMRRALENQPRLKIRQAEVMRVMVEHGAITGVETATGARILSRAVILCGGVYLKSRILIGDHSWLAAHRGWWPPRGSRIRSSTWVFPSAASKRVRPRAWTAAPSIFPAWNRSRATSRLRRFPSSRTSRRRTRPCAI